MHSENFLFCLTAWWCCNSKYKQATCNSLSTTCKPCPAHKQASVKSSKPNWTKVCTALVKQGALSSVSSKHTKTDKSHKQHKIIYKSIAQFTINPLRHPKFFFFTHTFHLKEALASFNDWQWYRKQEKLLALPLAASMHSEVLRQLSINISKSQTEH